MWIFWHDWWPWYLIGVAVIVWAIYGYAMIRAIRRRRRVWKPCVPISCPPVEEFEFSWTHWVCAICGRHPTREETVTEAGTTWRMVCSEHGVIASGATLNEGELEIGPIE